MINARRPWELFGFPDLLGMAVFPLLVAETHAFRPLARREFRIAVAEAGCGLQCKNTQAGGVRPASVSAAASRSRKRANRCAAGPDSAHKE
jgi:hypothetical protein